MKRLLAALAFAGVFLCLPAYALVLDIPLPPARYDRAYTGELKTINADIADVHKLCGSPYGLRVFACAKPDIGKCTIVLPRVEDGGVTKQQRERLRRHEIGHCNGWPADHPR